MKIDNRRTCNRTFVRCTNDVMLCFSFIEREHFAFFFSLFAVDDFQYIFIRKIHKRVVRQESERSPMSTYLTTESNLHKKDCTRPVFMVFVSHKTMFSLVRTSTLIVQVNKSSDERNEKKKSDIKKKKKNILFPMIINVEIKKYKFFF